jgi:hypothetical protein
MIAPSKTRAANVVRIGFHPWPCRLLAMLRERPSAPFPQTTSFLSFHGSMNQYYTGYRYIVNRYTGRRVTDAASPFG